MLIRSVVRLRGNRETGNPTFLFSFPLVLLLMSLLTKPSGKPEGKEPDDVVFKVRQSVHKKDIG